MKINVLYLFTYFSVCFTCYSQDYVQIMRNSNESFYTVQQAFNTYWDDRAMEKGKGYKAFKRWEAYMEPRVYPSGNMTLPSQNYENYVKWQNQKNNSNLKSIAGNWTFLGPVGKPSGGGTGRLNFIRFDPTNSNTVYVGAPDGGLWKTVDGGANWATNTDQLSVLGVSDIAIDPTNTQVMYLATGDGDAGDTYSLGVLKSLDGGTTWQPTGLTWTSNLGRTISRLLINPLNPQVILAFGSNGIWRSSDGGSSWTQPNGSINGLKDAEFKPGNTNTIYAAGSSFIKSTDGGINWATISTGLSGIGRLAIAVTEANPAYVYVLASNITNSGFLALIRSTDSGNSFTTQMNSTGSNNILGWDQGMDIGGQGWYDLAIAVSPTNSDEIYTGGVNIWRSTNGGASFELNTHWYGNYNKPYVHADIHDIVFLPGSGSVLFSANDGGLFKSTNSGVTWTDISSNISIAQQYRIGLSSSSSNLLVSGHQDNGTNKLYGLSWSQIYGGDGMDCFIDWSSNSTIYASYVFGEYLRSTNGGLNWTAINNGLPYGGSNGEEWLCVWHQDPVSANILYAGGRSALYKSIDAGDHWTSLGTPTGSGSIKEFVISPSNNQVIYSIKNGFNGISKSIDGGYTFSSINNGLPTNVAPTNITVSNSNPNIIFVTYSGYDPANKVFKSTNGGNTWINISNGLPNLPVNTIVYNNNSSNDAIYIGMDMGIYYKDNTSNWIPFNMGLPNVTISDLEIYYPTNRIRCATFGRGTWESDLYEEVPNSPIASFTSSNTTICQNQTVSFTNTSTNQPTAFFWSFPGGSPSTSTDQNPIVNYFTGGVYDVSLTVTNSVGSNTISQNDLITVMVGDGTVLPVNENFGSSNFPPPNWTIINLDQGSNTWDLNLTIGNMPSTGNSMWFNNYNIDDTGNEDEIRTSTLDFQNYGSVNLSFDVAYAAYGPNNIDGLEVLVSSDCGQTYNSVYLKTGSTVEPGNLPTAPETSIFFEPTSSEWRTETVDLSDFAGLSNIIIAFRNLANFGNALYIDNISIAGMPAVGNHIWTGSISTNPYLAGNWNPGQVPPSNENIIVPSGLSIYPHYLNLTLDTNANFTLKSGSQLTVNGILNNLGTLTIESGATFLQGANSSLAGNGTYNVNQFVTGSGGSTPNGRFWYMGIPFNSLMRAFSFSQAGPSNLLWSWSESGQTWSSPIGNTTFLNATKGYVFRTGTNVTLNFSGTSLYSANASITGLTNSGGSFDGCHLMSNPYTAYLDWEAVIADAGTTNLASTYCVRSFNTGSNTMVYDTYNANGDVAVNPSGVAMTRYIAPMQAFWIRVNPSTTGTLSMTKAMLSHQPLGVGLKDITSFPAFARLNLVSDNFYDQVVIYTDANATAEFDDYDSKKFFLPNVPQVYCQVGENKTVINALKKGKAQTSAPLTIELPSTQVFKFEMAESFVENGLVILEDKQEGIFQDMGVNPVYEFYGNSGVIADRFVLHFQLPNGTNNEGQAGVEDLTNGQIAVVANHDGAVTVALSTDLTSAGDIQIFDETGRLVAQKEITSAQTNLQITNGMGVYFVRVQTPMKTAIKKVMVY